MIFQLAMRNLRQQFNRRLFVAMIIGITVSLLLVGNSIFQASDDGVQTTYRDSFTGDFTISSEANTPFTLFGNDLPLVGDYETLPVLAEPEEVLRKLKNTDGIATIVPQVSAQAIVQVGGIERTTSVFGVDFSTYFEAFPALVRIDARFPKTGNPGILFNQAYKNSIESKLGRKLRIKEPIQLVSTNMGGFTIREVPYYGSYSYPVVDEMLERIVLVDPDTARALNGYVYGANRVVTLDTEQTRLLDTVDSVDNLFGPGVIYDKITDAENGLDLQVVEKDLSESKIVNSAAKTQKGAWNFFIVFIKPGLNTEVTGFSLRQIFSVDNSGLQIRDWRASAGGNAQLLWFVRILFNIGMFFVVIIAIFVMTNALALSVRERTKEIGTMRALGASKFLVIRLLGLETLVLVIGAGACGVGAGGTIALALGKIGIPLSNPFLEALFGATTLHPVIDLPLVIGHLVLCVLIGFVALIFPLKVALDIQPISAMAREV